MQFSPLINVKLSLCLTKHHAMKTYWRNEEIAPRILNRGTRWMWVVSYTPQSLYPLVKRPRYLLVRRLGGPHSRSGLGDEKKKKDPIIVPDENWTSVSIP